MSIDKRLKCQVYIYLKKKKISSSYNKVFHECLIYTLKFDLYPPGCEQVQLDQMYRAPNFEGSNFFFLICTYHVKIKKNKNLA